MIQIVRNVTVLLLISGILVNLFPSVSYRKYFNYIIGLIVIIIVVQPVFSWLTGDEIMNINLEKSIFAETESDFEEELKIVSEKSKEKVLENYKDKVKKDIMERCNAGEDSCKIELGVNEQGDVDSMKILLEGVQTPLNLNQQLAEIYQIKEENIWIESR